MTEHRYTHAQWEQLVHETVERILWLGKVKGGEYAKDEDRLANFRTNAIALGTNMELVWGVYAGKHWDSIRTYISDMVKGVQRERSEPIEGRVDDLITYLLLFKAIVREQQETRPLQAPSSPPKQGMPSSWYDNLPRTPLDSGLGLPLRRKPEDMPL